MISPQEYEKIIIKLLFKDKEIQERIFPYLCKEVFDSSLETLRLYDSITSYNQQYDKFPSEQELEIFLKTEDLTKTWQEVKAVDVAEDLEDAKATLEQVENYIKMKLIMAAKDEMTEGVISQDFGRVAQAQDKITEAIGFTIQQEVGIEPFEEVEKVYEELARKDSCITTGVDSMDKVMGGGYPIKTLNLIIGGTNIGKTMLMSSSSLAALKSGKHVLYITFEDSRAEIARRVFQNFLDFSREDTMIKESLIKKINKLKPQIKGRFKIYEAEGGIFSVAHLRNLLKELKSKNKFIPDVIFIDYLAYMTTKRINKDAQTAERLKFVAQDLKSFAFRTGVPIISGAQLNRGGFASKNPGLSDLAECFALSNIADNAWVFVTNEEMYSQKMISAILTKSRVGNKYAKLILNFDPDIQRAWSTEENATPTSARDEDLLDDMEVNRYKNMKTVTNSMTERPIGVSKPTNYTDIDIDI